MRLAARRKYVEQRRAERTQLALEGRIFVPAEDATIDCRIVDLSASGAGVQCAEMPPLQTFVVLYVEGFGRFEAVVARVVGEVLGLRFVFTDSKRKRLTDRLARYIAGGAIDPTSLRRHKRVPGPPVASFVREKGGEKFSCEVVDISLTGASLKTNQRPLIGETVLIGRMPACVVRYHDNGFAVVFRIVPKGGIEA